MGLFSFIKEAGEKLFGSEEPKAEITETVETALTTDVRSPERERILMDKMLKMELPIKNLGIQVFGDKAVVSGVTEIQAVRELTVITIGNTEGIATVDDQITVTDPKPEATFYTVQKGDYLSKIAKKVYGNAMKYNVIFEANKPMLTDPDKIYPGQVLRIPPLDK